MCLSQVSAEETPFTAEEDAQIAAADARFGVGDYTGAYEILSAMNDEVLSSTDARTEQQKRLGKVLLRLGDYDGAIAAFTNAIEFPLSDQTTALTDRCYAYLQVNLLLDAQQDCSQARREVELARLLGSNDPIEWLTQEYRSVSLSLIEASLFRRSGQLRQALEILDGATAVIESSAKDTTRDATLRLRVEDNWPLYLSRADVMGEIGRYEEALASLSQLEAVVPDSELHRVLATRASLLRNSGELEAAVGAWLRAAEAVPLLQEESGSLARAANEYLFLACASLLRAQRHEEALGPCGKVAEADKTNGYFAEANAVALLRARGWAQAWPEAMRAVQLQEETPIGTLTLRQFLASAQQSAAETLVPRSPGDAPALTDRLPQDAAGFGLVNQARRYLGLSE
ncbi:hypothetical protein K3725_04905 [Leisingera sp. S132]|uniref:hypothetical protein n=1 Tax=Leisingera sp. S132 TaxID=2867016 RepID=UPI0021A67B0D|nr:hypothetical protein [Leisingera sp. S132]UWQ80354.1 hypothetical protein K3725_04905 [Leisingera sp. S132]